MSATTVLHDRKIDTQILHMAHIAFNLNKLGWTWVIRSELSQFSWASYLLPHCYTMRRLLWSHSICNLLQLLWLPQNKTGCLHWGTLKPLAAVKCLQSLGARLLCEYTFISCEVHQRT